MNTKKIIMQVVKTIANNSKFSVCAVKCCSLLFDVVVVCIVVAKDGYSFVCVNVANVVNDVNDVNVVVDVQSSAFDDER